MGRTYKTMQGKEVDMDKLMRQHELMPAIGNVRVNARGDELGPGGKIIRKREEVLQAYYENNPKAIPERSGVVVSKTEQSGIVESSKKSKTAEE